MSDQQLERPAAELSAASGPRVIALVAGVAVAIGSIGPWGTTFIGDASGTDSDGVITLILAVVAAVLVMTRSPESRWLLLATVLGILCAFTGIADIIEISASHQQVFSPDLRLVSTGWGIWLMTIAAGVFTVGSYWYRAETPGDGAS